MYDIIIRGGTIVDGTGAPRHVADVAVENGRIVAIAPVIEDDAREEIDARGRLVTPGFIDIHTHYDGQVSWDTLMEPSSGHGVTTVVIGNCGVGFAPVRKGHEEWLVQLMEGVEDIPGTALHEGIQWEWETFPEYLDAIDRRRYAVDVAAYVPHGAVRGYVMGERGANREPATEDDRRRMAALTGEGLRAGALGFSTSRTLNHRAADGRHIPTLRAEEAELTAIARAMRAAGTGWLQIVSDFEDQDGEIGLFRRLAEASGRPVSLTVLQSDKRPEAWREILAGIAEANREGLALTAQIRSRPTSVLLGFELSQNPFMGRPSYKKIAAGRG